MKRSLLCLLILLSFIQLKAQSPLQLDNKTLCDEIDLAVDPFLILRTKFTKRESHYDVIDSVQRVASGLKKRAENPISFTQVDELSARVGNSISHFDHIKPFFKIETSAKAPDKIWWQISNENTFSQVATNLDQIEAFTPEISLDAIAETFLNPGQDYFFRFRAFEGNLASPWSAPFRFLALKPEALSKIYFEKSSSHCYEISWEYPDSDVDFLIYGSNSQDFIPSLYFDKQIKSLVDGEVTEYEPNYNFIAATSSKKISIDGSLAYYRIIVKKFGQYSTPSPLIYVYDNALDQKRDRLVPTELSRLIQRQSLVSTKDKFKKYLSNPYISSATWEVVSPYLLPANHPIRSALDRIFSKERVTQDILAMKEAGFITKGPGIWSHTVFGRHKKLKPYAVKMIGDDKDVNEVEKFIQRIEGVNTAREIIQRHKLKHLMKAPRKWLYPLPQEPSPPFDSFRKNFILVTEDMKVYHGKDNFPLWKSDKVTRELLDAVFILLKEGGLCDSVQVFNIPFSEDGRLAVIDTEFHHIWPVDYEKMSKFLNDRNKEYWRALFQKG